MLSVFDEMIAKSQIPLRYLVRSWSAASFEPASVMEFGFKDEVDLTDRLT